MLKDRRLRALPGRPIGPSKSLLLTASISGLVLHGRDTVNAVFRCALYQKDVYFPIEGRLHFFKMIQRLVQLPCWRSPIRLHSGVLSLCKWRSVHLKLGNSKYARAYVDFRNGRVACSVREGGLG